MDEHNPVDAWVRAAQEGSQSAWDALVERFNPLVMGITRRYRLDPADASDVGQTVWLRLVQHLGGLRDPAALPGWLATTTRNECLRVIRQDRRTQPTDPQETWVFDRSAEQPQPESQLLADELHEALLQAFATLPDRQRRLLQLLLGDPPPSYEEISTTLDMPIGAIGPTRARALEKLRRSRELMAHSLTLDLRGGPRVQA